MEGPGWVAGRASLCSIEPQEVRLQPGRCEEATFPRGAWLPLPRRGSFIQHLGGPTTSEESPGLLSVSLEAKAVEHRHPSIPQPQATPTGGTALHVSWSQQAGTVLSPPGTAGREASGTLQGGTRGCDQAWVSLVIPCLGALSQASPQSPGTPSPHQG